MKLYIVDIDGCLNYYPKTKVDFANYYFNLQRPFRHLFLRFKTLDEIKTRLTKDAYEKMTSAYRKSNYKHQATPNKSLVKMVRYWAKDNDVAIITARSDDGYMQTRTKRWLRKNQIPFKYVLFTKSKQTMLKCFLESGKYESITMIDDNLNNLAKCEDMYEALLEKDNLAKCNFIWVKHKYNKKHRYEISRYSRIKTTTYKKIDKEAKNGREI